MNLGFFGGNSFTSVLASIMKQVFWWQYGQFYCVYCDEQACTGGNVHEYAQK